MNWTDYLLVGILGISIMVGLWRGLVSEVLSLAVWVAAFWVAWRYGPVVAAHFEYSITQPQLRLLAGYAVCLIGVMIAGALLRVVLGRLLASSGLSGPDRLLGMVFGFARGVLLVALMVFLLGLTAVTRETWWRESVMLPHFQVVATWLANQLPPDAARYLQPSPELLDQLPKLPDVQGVTDPARLSELGRMLAPAATSSAAAVPSTAVQPSGADAQATPAAAPASSTTTAAPAAVVH